MIKQLLNSVVAKYRYLSVYRRSIICLSRRLSSEKSRSFAQPRPIVVNYLIAWYNWTNKATVEAKIHLRKVLIKQVFLTLSQTVQCEIHSSIYLPIINASNSALILNWIVITTGLVPLLSFCLLYPLSFRGHTMVLRWNRQKVPSWGDFRWDFLVPWQHNA